MDYKLFGIQFNIVNVAICVALGFLIAAMLACNCLNKKKVLEAYTSMRYHLQPEMTDAKPQQMGFFNGCKFSPECCDKAPYSNGNGCACLSDEQSNYLNKRGGNRSGEPANY